MRSGRRLGQVILLLTVPLVLSFSLHGQTQGNQLRFEDWFKSIFDREVERAESEADKHAKIVLHKDQTAPSQQVEAPSMSGNSTSMVNHASASDLIGMALNLAGLSGNDVDGKDTTSGVFTINPYLFLATANGKDPMDPDFYSKHKKFRNLSFTLGFDNEEDKAAGTEEQGTVFGVKFRALDRRMGRNLRKDLLNVMEDSAQHHQDIRQEVQKYLHRTFGSSDTDFVSFRREVLNNPSEFGKLVPQIDEKEIVKRIRSKVPQFVELAKKSKQVGAALRKGGELSFGVLSKRRKTGPDEYMGELIYDYGLHQRVDFTVNGSFEFMDLKTGKDQRGGRVASQLLVRLTPEKVGSATKPATFSVAGDAKGMTGMEPIYRLQTKLTFPIANGIDFPLSMTFSNRTELIDESDVRGQFGFTFDLSRLMLAAKDAIPALKPMEMPIPRAATAQVSSAPQPPLPTSIQISPAEGKKFEFANSEISGSILGSFLESGDVSVGAASTGAITVSVDGGGSNSTIPFKIQTLKAFTKGEKVELIVETPAGKVAADYVVDFSPTEPDIASVILELERLKVSGEILTGTLNGDGLIGRPVLEDATGNLVTRTANLRIDTGPGSTSNAMNFQVIVLQPLATGDTVTFCVETPNKIRCKESRTVTVP